MIRCGKVGGTAQCVLFSKDGSKVLGRFPFSEHGGEEGARAAAGKREGQVQTFKHMEESLEEAIEVFGSPAVLKHILEDALGCEGCEELILKSAFDILDTDGQDVEKARKRRKRRITIEDEDDDDDGVEERTKPPPAEEGEDRETEPPPTEEGGGEKEEPPPAGGEGEGKPAQGDAGLPEGWTPESLQKYWQSLGGSVEECVKNAPKSAKDPSRFCTRLQAKVAKLGGEKEGGGGAEQPPRPPVAKSAEDVLGLIADLVVEKAEERGEGGYKGEVGWDDPPSWLKAGTPNETREKVWKAMGSTHRGCMAKVRGKVDDPGRFCAALKDKVLGTTMWRGKKKGEEPTLKSSEEEILAYFEKSEPTEPTELDEIAWLLGDEDLVEKAEGAEADDVPDGDLMIVDESGAEVSPDAIIHDHGLTAKGAEGEGEGEAPDFLGFVREVGAKRERRATASLAEQLASEGE